jgi:hypothetical protein
VRLIACDASREGHYAGVPHRAKIECTVFGVGKNPLDGPLKRFWRADITVRAGVFADGAAILAADALALKNIDDSGWTDALPAISPDYGFQRVNSRNQLKERFC